MWRLFLAIWMIMYGIAVLTNITVVAYTIIMGVLAFLIAIFILWEDGFGAFRRQQ